jgi:hypothetical protein
MWPDRRVIDLFGIEHLDAEAGEGGPPNVMPPLSGESSSHRLPCALRCASYARCPIRRGVPVQHKARWPNEVSAYSTQGGTSLKSQDFVERDRATVVNHFK